MTSVESPSETPLLIIPLTDPLALRDAEISGMAWYGDYLILLPQYPNMFATQGDGYIFALPKSEIVAFLDGESTEPLDPIQIPFFAPGLRQDIAGFEGYEAIAVDGNNFMSQSRHGHPIQSELTCLQERSHLIFLPSLLIRPHN